MAQRVRVYLAMSLDGYIAGPDDDLSWLDGHSNDPAAASATGGLGFAAFLEQVGAMVMGRRTYDVVAGFPPPWPYGSLPVLVATHRPLPPVAGANARAVSGDIDALLDAARAEAGGKDVYLDGGVVIRQAVERDLVDEYVLTVVPVALGRGIPLFAGLSARRTLRFTGHHDFAGLVQLVATRP